MTRRSAYQYYLVLAVLLALSGCRQRFDQRLTLWRNDKIAYGTYYAYNSLNHIFRNATVQTSSAGPRNLDYNDKEKQALIVIGKTVWPSLSEVNSLLYYVSRGNYVFISAFTIRPSLLDSFRLVTSATHYHDSMTVSLNHPVTNDSLSFTYPGYPLDKYFTSYDTAITSVLGRDEEGRPNFVRFNYDGGGAIFFHLAPTAFTNFFLLHKDNKRYYDLALSQIPDNVSRVLWDDYFRHHFDGESESAKNSFSKLSLFLSDPVLRWAFWLAILLIVIVYVFESKRKQRVIPVVKPVRNTSLDFVDTIGRLYYQRKDNVNLFSKIAAQFMGHVRHRYKISSSEPDDTMEKSLAFKSGYDAGEIRAIFDQIRRFSEATEISDEELLEFNNRIDKFYKQT